MVLIGSYMNKLNYFRQQFIAPGIQRGHRIKSKLIYYSILKTFLTMSIVLFKSVHCLYYITSGYKEPV